MRFTVFYEANHIWISSKEGIKLYSCLISNLVLD